MRQVFEWVGRDRLSIGEVTRRLRAQGVKTATNKDWWDRTSVWGMLKNPAYKPQCKFRSCTLESVDDTPRMFFVGLCIGAARRTACELHSVK